MIGAGRAREITRRAVTLVETLALVIVIAVATPPLVMAATASARASAESRHRALALHLASAALETVIADAASGEPSLDLAAMGDAEYLDDPAAGVYARLERVGAAADAASVRLEVVIGESVDAEGSAVDPSDATATRLVTATATYPTSAGPERVALRTVVGRL